MHREDEQQLLGEGGDWIGSKGLRSFAASVWFKQEKKAPRQMWQTRINLNHWYHVLIVLFSVLFYMLKMLIIWGFPGGAVVENLPANAGDMGSSPGLGRSHMPQSNWAREPQLLSLRVWSLCSATGEAAIVRGPRTAMKSGPHLPQLEKALAWRRRPNTAKSKIKLIKKKKS